MNFVLNGFAGHGRPKHLGKQCHSHRVGERTENVGGCRTSRSHTSSNTAIFNCLADFFQLALEHSPTPIFISNHKATFKTKLSQDPFKDKKAPENEQTTSSSDDH